jgi:hypothetical protein
VFKKDRKEAKREKEFGNDLDGATYYWLKHVRNVTLFT